MVAAMVDIRTNELRAVHRTAFEGSRKVDRKFLGRSIGCVIKLTADEHVEQGLHVAEGLETALYGAQHFDLKPVWACGSDGGIAAFPIIAGIDALTILIDHDQSGAGDAAARLCAERWLAAGREIFSARSPIEGEDMNDIRVAS
jgi:hypothetical protein